MKRFYAVAISIGISMFLTSDVSAQNSSNKAGTQAKRDQAIAERLFTAWNSHDADKVAAAFSDDAVYEDVTAGHISRGKDDVRKWAAGGFTGIADFKMEVVNSFFHSGRGVVEWVWSGTDIELFRTGKKFSVRGVSVIEIRKGKIIACKDFYDFSAAMKQLGVLPAGKE